MLLDVRNSQPYSNSTFSPLLPHSVPPIVVPLAPGQQVIGNELDSATLSFRIDEASPPILLQDLQWFYVADFGNNPFAGQEITDLTNRTTVSTLTISDFDGMRYINLTVSNITQQRRGIGGETDEGRYFLVATNPGGVRFSYIDLLVFGTYSYVVCECVCAFENEKLSTSSGKYCTTAAIQFHDTDKYITLAPTQKILMNN